MFLKSSRPVARGVQVPGVGLEPVERLAQAAEVAAGRGEVGDDLGPVRPRVGLIARESDDMKISRAAS